MGTIAMRAVLAGAVLMGANCGSEPEADGNGDSDSDTSTEGETGGDTADTDTPWCDALTFGSPEYDAATAVAVAPNNSVYVAGYVDTDPRGDDIVVAKYTVDGSQAWLRMFGSVEHDHADALAVGADGSIYVAATVRGTVDDAPHHGQTDAIVVKLDVDGNTVWTHGIGTAADESPIGLQVRDDRVLLLGWTTGQLTADAGSGRTFLLQLDSLGTRQSLVLFGGDQHVAANGGLVDAQGHVFLTGEQPREDEDPDEGNDPSHVFVSRADPLGVPRWIQILNSSGEDEGHAVALDDAGGLYVTGSVHNALPGLASAGFEDIFVARLDVLDGAVTWTRQLGTAGEDHGRAVLAAPQGGVFVAGWLDADVDDGRRAAGHSRIGRGGRTLSNQQAALVYFDANGSPTWMHTPGSQHVSYVDLALASGGRLFAAGVALHPEADGGDRRVGDLLLACARPEAD